MAPKCRFTSLRRQRISSRMKIELSLSVYSHAAQFIGKRPWEVSRSLELMVAAHRAAYEVYRHAPVVVGIDIYNLEAEAYGCAVREPEGNGIPAIVEHPFSSAAETVGIRPFDPNRDGRLPAVIEAARRLREAIPEADVRVPLSGPFSIAQNLLGLTALLTETALAPEGVRALLHRLVEGQIAFSRAVKDAGLGVAFFESAAAPPLLSPAQFREVELPPLKEVMGGVADVMGRPVPCIIGGDTCPIIPEMLATGTRFLICPAETDRVRFLERMRAHSEVTVRVNLPTHVYTRGPRERIRAEIDAVCELAAGRANVLLGTGAIPYGTPVENVLFIREYVS